MGRRRGFQRAGNRIIGFHVCDWLTPTTDFLNDRGLMGEGCIDIKGIRAMIGADPERIMAILRDGTHRYGAVLKHRDVMGATDPSKAAEGTIRKLHAKSIGENSVHGSDSAENAAIEIAQFFSGNEIVG